MSREELVSSAKKKCGLVTIGSNRGIVWALPKDQRFSIAELYENQNSVKECALMKIQTGRRNTVYESSFYSLNQEKFLVNELSATS